MKNWLLFLVVLGLNSINLNSQHTFSIVAVDSTTGELGSAGATCLDSAMLNGEEGALVISDIVLGHGVIHTQAYWNPANQANARKRMLLGDSPDQIIEWLIEHDMAGGGKTIANRQYGIVDLNGGKPRVAAYTGDSNIPEAGHILGVGYSIQGNILLEKQVLEDMEAAFLSTEGTLGDRLMASLQAAKRVGADSRCTVHGVSSLSAFIPSSHTLTMPIHRLVI